MSASTSLPAEASTRTGSSIVTQAKNTGSSKSMRKTIYYYQTHRFDGEFVSILPVLRKDTGVTHVIVAAIHLNERAGDITLNDDPYGSSRHDRVWDELRVLQRGGIKVLGMLGGAHQGSYRVLDGNDVTVFEAYYQPLRKMVEETSLDGLDLDVEEDMSLPGIVRLIDRLKADFGPEFIITMAPVVTALQMGKHLSGFNYEDLEKAMAHNIAWYNTQFYCGWGSLENTTDYDRVVAHGWAPHRVIVGMVTNPENGRGWVSDETLRETLTTLSTRYPDFGGVMGWEYFNSITVDEPHEGPWCWARMMAEIFRSPD